jgi:hypothetical protein
MSLTPAEKQLAITVGFDEDVCDLVKQECRAPLRRLTAFSELGELEDVDGIAVTALRDEVMPIIGKLQPQLLPHGYRAFWSETCAANGSSRSEVVALLKGVDDSAIVRLQRTSGGNYGVSNAAILEKVQSWRGQCELQLVGAGGAWVAIQFTTLPDNVCAFAEEIYEFCPDSVEQGVGLQNENDHLEKFAAARRLCPALSAELERKLDEQKARFAAMKIPPGLRAMIDSSGFSTPTDMGIRLLAYEIFESRQLFLWWD